MVAVSVGEKNSATDFQVFVFANFGILTFIILGFLGDRKWAIFPFCGGLFGALFFTSMTDGNIINAYAYSAGFITQTTSDYPLILMPIFMTLLAFGATIWKVFEGIDHAGEVMGLFTVIGIAVSVIAYGVPGTLVNLYTNALTNVPASILPIIQITIPFLAVTGALVMIIGVLLEVLRRIR